MGLQETLEGRGVGSGKPILVGVGVWVRERGEGLGQRIGGEGQTVMPSMDL